jgi:hypothetical protein
MNLQSVFSTTSRRDDITFWHQIPQYVICAGLGLLGGAVGVAMAIGLAIVVQLALPPLTVFMPGIIPLAIVAVLAGVVVSWLFNLTVRMIWPALGVIEHGVQVMLVTSVLVSLLQVILFMHNL